MRRHPPRLIVLADTDRRELERLVGDGRTEQRVARRGRVLLAMENPATVVQNLAEQVGMTSVGVWQVCRRYEERGLQAVFDAPRSGRPPLFSPLGEGAN